jgi:hypothetical protein
VQPGGVLCGIVFVMFSAVNFRNGKVIYSLVKFCIGTVRSRIVALRNGYVATGKVLSL